MGLSHCRCDFRQCRSELVQTQCAKQCPGADVIRRHKVYESIGTRKPHICIKSISSIVKTRREHPRSESHCAESAGGLECQSRRREGQSVHPCQTDERSMPYAGSGRFDRYRGLIHLGSGVLQSLCRCWKETAAFLRYCP